MRFTKLEIENIRCFESTTVDLDRGVTVVHGPNGSGKTTLLEAAFFALYGAQALSETLDQFITTGATEATVALTFRHDNTSYRVFRRLRRRDDRASTAECTLEADGGETTTGARAVRDRISSMLRMDTESFVNCAYVRQGEINKLIHASPATRQDIIDGLLQLGVLETYRDRAGTARLAVEDHLGELTGELSGVTDRIEAKEDANLPAKLNELETERAAVTSDIDRLETQLEQARDRRDEAIEVLDTYEENQQRRDELTERIETLQETIEDTEAERERLRDSLSELRDRHESLSATREELAREAGLETVSDAAIETALETARSERTDRSDQRSEIALAHQRHLDAAEAAADRADDRASEAEQARAEAEALAEEIAELEVDIEARREELDELIAERDAEVDAFDDVDFALGEAAMAAETVSSELTAVTDELNEARGQLEAVKERIDRGEALLAEDRCPECGQSLDGAPHVDNLDESRARRDELTAEVETLEQRKTELEQRRDRIEAFRDREQTIEHLTDQIETMRELIADREGTIADKNDRRDTLLEEADTLAADAGQARDEATHEREQAAGLADELAALDDELEAIAARIETLETLRDTHNEYTTVTDTIEQHRERRSLLGEQNEERKQTLTELRNERAQLEAELDADRIEAAKEAKGRAEAYLEKHESTLESLKDQRDELQGQIGRVNAELDELDELKAHRDELTVRKDRLETIHDETTSLETLYDDLKTDLRLRNVQLLDDLLNETFELVYYDDAYDHIELSEDYELTVYQKDGTPLDPTQLSGGERALFNLSLRSAIYRLLAEGIEGDAPMPPLILDEPTVFLDAEHVAQLVELIDAMRELGVEQILVVSHDDELIDAAEHLVTVQKDATTNRSRVNSTPQPTQLPN